MSRFGETLSRLEKTAVSFAFQPGTQASSNVIAPPQAPPQSSADAAPRAPSEGPQTSKSKSTSTSQGFISKHLTSSAGGGTHQYSKQKMMSDAELQKQLGPDRFNEIAGKIKANFGPRAQDPKTLNQIMNVERVESNFNPNATGDKGTSFNEFQVHVPAHKDYVPGKTDPYAYAGKLFQSRGFKDWETSRDRLGIEE